MTTHLGVVGDQAEPFSGRAWVRRFEGGEFEVLYRSGDGPRETEKFNQWLNDAGIANSVRTLRTGWSETREPRESDPEDNAARSARRAKQQLRWKVKAIRADQMLTLTTRANETDLAASKRAFQKFIARCRREWLTFRYVAVPEQQERGAWHWHLAVNGWQNYDKLRGFWWQALGHKVVWTEGGKPVLRDAPNDSTAVPGSVNGKMPKRRGRTARTWDAGRMACYLSKYIGKTIGHADGDGASYSCSRGITWAVERYAVRAQSFTSVASVLVGALVGPAAGVHWWQDASRSVLWCAGVEAVEQGPPVPAP